MLAELIARVSRGRDREAFKALFGHFAPKLKGFFLRGGQDDGSAEDLTQETMLRIWQRAAQFDPARAAPAAWVFGIARNLRVDRLRQEYGRRPPPEVGPPEACAPGPDPVAAAIRAQQAEILLAALRGLPAAQREAVHRAFLDELTHAEAHRALGVALGTLKSRLRLALARLRDALDEPA